MAKNKSLSQFPPLIFNVFKPARMTSYDVIRHFKRNLPSGFGKIGHFGTLDPFASGVLLIGIGGAARLNDYIHDFLPKTYLAVGKLGIETPTGDYESEITQRDDSLYLKREIAAFSPEFIQERLRLKFVGEYWQAPHKYSASKFMGRNLHEWAREGIEVKKEPVLRHVHDIQVVRYKFPYLSVRVTVSSGTYVRTLFNHMSNELGTIGSLIALSREKIGEISSSQSLKMKDWPHERELEIIQKGLRVDKVLPFSEVTLNDDQTKAFKNGAFLRPAQLEIKPNGKLSEKLFWMLDQEQNLLGMGEQTFPEELKPKINFHSVVPGEL
jgi:tRNA pseudouridine55 synthase